MGLQATSRIKRKKFFSKNFDIRYVLWCAVLLNLSHIFNTKSKKILSFKRTAQQSIVKLITNGKATNCWSFELRVTIIKENVHFVCLCIGVTKCTTETRSTLSYF